jgi:hypothetical protein
MSRVLSSKCQELLDLQHGVVARWQAVRAGQAPCAIDGQIKSGRWQPLYRGVYAAFTGTPSRMAILQAAVLRAGPGAALSYWTAAELDGITDKPSAMVHVTVGPDRRVSLSGSETAGGLPALVVHRCARITQARHPARLPHRTRVEETVVDLVQVAVDAEAAFSWAAQACGRRLTTPGLLLQVIRARAKCRWRRELTAGLADISEGVLSVLERRYVRQIERPHGLPQAARQSRNRAGARTRYFDNYYHRFGLVVELDGQAAHPAEARWRDVRRDNASAALGLTTLRYGWADITVHPCRTAAEIAAALTARGWQGHLRACSPMCGHFHDPGNLSADSANRLPGS